ncbi:MAG: fatty acid desaturase [Pseudomonadota bacterium]
MTTHPAPPRDIEWPTLGLALACYAAWVGAVFGLAQVSLWAAIPALVLVLTLQSSLQHEVIHGHPLPDPWLSAALGILPLGLFVPFARFRDLHLEHHRDSDLTDPYDDPESNYLDPKVWAALPDWVRWLCSMNNTLLGRMALGPALGLLRFATEDLKLIRAGDRSVARAWTAHLILVGGVLAVVMAAPMPVWAYLTSAYLGLSILKIRTFAEHRAHEKARARTVIIEDRGLLAFLFLNNNLHVVHHMHPGAPWYTLPALYRARATHYRACNDHYVFRNYAEVFRHHAVRAKDPVPHPLWPRA